MRRPLSVLQGATMTNRRTISYLLLIIPVLSSLLLFGSWRLSQEVFIHRDDKEGLQYTENQTLWKSIDYSVCELLNEFLVNK